MTVINALLKDFVREQAITVSARPTPRPEKLAEWARINEEMDRGNLKTFSNVEDLISHLGLEK